MKTLTETPSQYGNIKTNEWGLYHHSNHSLVDVSSAIVKFITNECYMHYSDMLKIILFATNNNLITKGQNNRYYIDGLRIMDELYTSILMTLGTQPRTIDDSKLVEMESHNQGISQIEKTIVYNFVEGLN